MVVVAMNYTREVEKLRREYDVLYAALVGSLRWSVILWELLKE